MEKAGATINIGQGGRFEPEFRAASCRLAWFTGALVLAFALPLYELARLSLKVDLYSHALAMPLIAGYLVWLTRHRLPERVESSRGAAMVLVGIGVLCLAGWAAMASRGPLMANDRLAFLMGAFVSFFAAGVFNFMGTVFVRAVAYPLGLLIFMLPFPTPVRHALEVALQYGSAEAAYWLIKAAQIPVFRDGVVFVLPNITLQVAEECSGIRSSFVLFITGLMAGFLFLESPRHRLWFTLLTIPLGILRNGFRVLTLAFLCVHIDPALIHSPIHHRGGPIFFALSLVPFFALLLYWRKKELRAKSRALEPCVALTNS